MIAPHKAGIDYLALRCLDVSGDDEAVRCYEEAIGVALVTGIAAGHRGVVIVERRDRGEFARNDIRGYGLRPWAVRTGHTEVAQQFMDGVRAGCHPINSGVFGGHGIEQRDKLFVGDATAESIGGQTQIVLYRLASAFAFAFLRFECAV